MWLVNPFFARFCSAAGTTHFAPSYDADGNQTLVKTSTGVWSVEYNAENRPVTFTRTEGTVTTRVTCTYDCMGRRATKKVETNGETTLHQRYLYRGYLQIAACALTSDGTPALWHILWDPTQPIATRPLAIQKSGTWYCYGWDLTKNICELFKADGTLATTYTYTPYGEETANRDVIQPLQWSSEFNEKELGLIYYNFRNYNPLNANWLIRDFKKNAKGNNLYILGTSPAINFDILGLDVYWSSTANMYLGRPTETSVRGSAFPAFPASPASRGSCCGPDTTEWLTKQIKINIDFFRMRYQEFINNIVESEEGRDGILSYMTFYSKYVWKFRDLVNHRGAWDYKRGDFSSENCPSKGCEKTVTICGKCYPKDIVGNISYAAVGRYLFPKFALRNGGHAAAAPDWFHSILAFLGIAKFDSVDDVATIEVGLNFYDSDLSTTSLCSLLSSRQHENLVDSSQLEKVQSCAPCKEKCNYSR